MEIKKNHRNALSDIAGNNRTDQKGGKQKDRVEKILANAVRSQALSLDQVFDLDKIQELQDALTDTTGIPLILVDKDGTPATKQSGARRLVAASGNYLELFDTIDTQAFGEETLVQATFCNQKVMDGGFVIRIGPAFAGVWLTGQVCREKPDASEMMTFASRLAVDYETVANGIDRLPVMDNTVFSQACQTLCMMGNLLSEMANTNARQSRLIKDILAMETKYQQLTERISDWIFVHDFDGTILESNLLFASKLGFSKSFFDKARVQDLMVERYRDRFSRYMKALLATGYDSGEMRVLAKDGTEYIVEYNSILVTLDSGRQVVKGAARDITERVRATKKLKANEEKYRNILTTMHEGYYEVDLAGTFVFVNDSIAKMLGYSMEELMGMNNRDFMTASTAKSVFAAYNRIYEGGKPLKRIDLEVITKAGDIRYAESSVNLIYKPSGKVEGYRGIVRDITEKKKMEIAMRNSAKKAKNARNVTILGLAKLSEYRDNDAGAHLERIREFSRIIATGLSHKEKYHTYITSAYIEDLCQSAILHDIGKVGVPDAVLCKPGKLTAEEFEIIKTHSVLGGDAIREIESKIEGRSFLTIAKEVAYHHHEKWNGTGYPFGLAGEAIPLSARIVAIADVYDALTSKRVYKEAFFHETAMEIILKESGQQFDPEIVDIFQEKADEFLKIRTELLDEDE